MAASPSPVSYYLFVQTLQGYGSRLRRVWHHIFVTLRQEQEPANHVRWRKLYDQWAEHFVADAASWGYLPEEARACLAWEVRRVLDITIPPDA